MKNSIIISVLLFFTISCSHIDNSKYIVNKWQLTNMKLSNNFDYQQYAESLRKNLMKTRGMELSEEQVDMIIHQKSEIVRDIEDGSWSQNIEKESIAFTENGNYLDYNSNSIGTYQLSLDGKRLMIKEGYNPTDTFKVINLTNNDLEISYYGIIKTYKVMD